MQYWEILGGNEPQIIEKLLSSGRIDRYLSEAGGNRNYAVSLYMWNLQLCEAFLMPLQFGEIAIRNAAQEALRHRYGEAWYIAAQFERELNDNYRNELRRVVADESAQHGASLKDGHIVSGLAFGFWEMTLSKRFLHLLWKGGSKHQFPGMEIAPMEKVRKRVEEMRVWRNRIAHHKTIFDREPHTIHEKIIEAIGWRNQDAAMVVKRISRIPATIARKPQTPA